MMLDVRQYDYGHGDPHVWDALANARHPLREDALLILERRGPSPDKPADFVGALVSLIFWTLFENISRCHAILHCEPNKLLTVPRPAGRVR